MTYAGHEEPWRQWRAALAGERMHHAWLLSGRRGIGKAAFALEAARELVGGPATGNHVDIVVLSHLPKDDKEKQSATTASRSRPSATSPSGRSARCSRS
jgi:DNA polymerase-3 subunit delta'